jgi:hypothetical protein
MQSLLGRLYDVDVRHDVDDFLVTDRAAFGWMAAGNDSRSLEEALFLAETADGAGVSLYVEPGVLQRLDASNPLGALTDGNLADYCTALEGVSHVV